MKLLAGNSNRALAQEVADHLDLPAFVLEQLRRSGVEQAEWLGRDTCAEEALFFSNRRAFKRGEADYGRLLSSIVLE